ncbi:MAG TPA: HAMP domain-containing sensor histidine kinase [Sedimentisphaerales bacterium]|jgi:signal transduction histidine kinase|nr:HAMP domain-containing sensor histidine kinase [Sedimentisphaerales bacterium]HNU28166.1 HAMP domain-containing sensor histidine kinase [Sedimentisphaerales bacterium]
MESLVKSTSLVQRAQWLIRLRWVAIGALGCATFGAEEFMGVSLAASALYAMVAVLLVYNLGLHGLLRHWTREARQPSEARIGGIITFQISADLLILATILHFSGGIENPFLFFFAFHMIIASILRSRRQSYLQATLAVGLFGGLVVLEAAGWLKHHSLEGFAGHGLYRDWTYVFGTLFVFTVTLYLIVYMTTSISEQLRRQQEGLERANAQLLEKDQVKNQYVLRVTHDIKGHLAAVLSCLDLVIDQMLGPLNDKQKDFIGRAHHRTTKCLEFITALLKLTRMKLTGRLEVEQFSLKKSILNALVLVRNKAQSKSVSLSHRIDPQVDLIWGEAVLVEETIANVLFNAVKYTPDGGKVSLEAGVEGDRVRIRVTDTGIGVPEADASRIFEEFYRAENARATEREGTGLGLAFARQVVERHGGRIWFENNPGGGSIFTFTLPTGPVAGGA